MNFFRIFTPVSYWVLILLWSFILIFYLRRLFNKKLESKFFATLITILAIDAFRTLFESIYFAAWYTSLVGFIPISIHHFLVLPNHVFIPKFINVIAAALVILIVLRHWLPEEEAVREKEIKHLRALENEIAERKKLETQIQQRNAELERSNAELDDFAYIVSHDLKEPLRSMHSFSSFLLEDHRERLDAEGQSYLNIVIQSTQRMAALLDDLLIYSRVGRVELSFIPTDLGRVAAEVIADMQSALEEHNARVTVAGNMPTFICDHVRIGEVFRNLIQNAVKYNDSKQKRVDVGWQATDGSDDSAAVFFVRDNGIGIREKHLGNVFKIFKRLHGRDQYGGGTGSGLTIVRKIVERHGGRVWVESEFGKGSTFYFTLTVCR